MSDKINDKAGITVTVYAIRKGVIYLADPEGKKYKIKEKAMPMPVHVGLILSNVKWS